MYIKKTAAAVSVCDHFWTSNATRSETKLFRVLRPCLACSSPLFVCILERSLCSIGSCVSSFLFIFLSLVALPCSIFNAYLYIHVYIWSVPFAMYTYNVICYHNGSFNASIHECNALINLLRRKVATAATAARKTNYLRMKWNAQGTRKEEAF